MYIWLEITEINDFLISKEVDNATKTQKVAGCGRDWENFRIKFRLIPKQESRDNSGSKNGEWEAGFEEDCDT